MIIREDIEQAIGELEKGEPTFQTVQRLADLYIVRDHLTGTLSVEGSEFLTKASGKEYNKVMSLMDELMQTTQVLNPRLYDSVLVRLSEL